METQNKKKTDTNRRLDFAPAQIKLYAGGITVNALQALSCLGLASYALSLEKSGREFLALKKPSKAAKLDYQITKFHYESVLDSGKAAAESAALIYAHSILDAVIYDLCCTSASIDPKAWVGFVSDRKVSFQEIGLNDHDTLRQKLLSNYLIQLERESLLFKCETLFKIVKPKRTRGILPGFKYSRERLVSLDQLRHDLVHKLMFNRRGRQMKARVDFLLNTGQFFVNLVSKHYKLSEG